MKSIRMKVREYFTGNYYDIGIFEGRKLLMINYIRSWKQKKAAIRNAKAMAKRIGIPYDPEIVKQHGC